MQVEEISNLAETVAKAGNHHVLYKTFCIISGKTKLLHQMPRLPMEQSSQLQKS